MSSTYPRPYSIHMGPRSLIAIKRNQVSLYMCACVLIWEPLPPFGQINSSLSLLVSHNNLPTGASTIQSCDQTKGCNLVCAHTHLRPRSDTIQFTKHGRRRRKRRRRKGGIVCHCIMKPVHDTIYSLCVIAFLCLTLQQFHCCSAAFKNCLNSNALWSTATSTG